MIAKEDLLYEIGDMIGNDTEVGFTPLSVYKVMDAYAKEIAIGFGKWLKENYYNNKPYSTEEQLFQTYIQTLQP